LHASCLREAAATPPTTAHALACHTSACIRLCSHDLLQVIKKDHPLICATAKTAKESIHFSWEVAEEEVLGELEVEALMVVLVGLAPHHPHGNKTAGRKSAWQDPSLS